MNDSSDGINTDVRFTVLKSCYCYSQSGRRAIFGQYRRQMVERIDEESEKERQRNRKWKINYVTLAVQILTLYTTPTNQRQPAFTHIISFNHSVLIKWEYLVMQKNLLASGDTRRTRALPLLTHLTLGCGWTHIHTHTPTRWRASKTANASSRRQQDDARYADEPNLHCNYSISIVWMI